jgi:hypothetical protein
VVAIVLLQSQEQRRSAAGTAPRVVFLGDSITDFWHLEQSFGGKDYITDLGDP